VPNVGDTQLTGTINPVFGMKLAEDAVMLATDDPFLPYTEAFAEASPLKEVPRYEEDNVVWLKSMIRFPPV
jgi:hypothetical protein